MHLVQRIPLKDVRIVAHLPGLVAREEVSRGHAITLLEARQVSAETGQLRLIFLNLMLQELAHSEINNLIRVPLGIEPFQHSEPPKRCGNCSHDSTSVES